MPTDENEIWGARGVFADAAAPLWRAATSPSWSRRLPMWGLVLVSVGGGCLPGLQEPDAGQADGGQPEVNQGGGSQTCTFDCFPHTTCVAGSVTSYPGAAITSSCSSHVECPSYAPHVCAQGCAVEGVSVSQSSANVEAFCAETPSKHVGDSCRSDEECLPNKAESQPDGTLLTTFLKCDGGKGACVQAPAVSSSTFGGTCDISRRVREGDGQVSPVNFGDGFCLAFTDAQAGCVRSGTTWPCVGDQQCPLGWYCATLVDLTRTDGIGAAAVCRPGPRGGIPTVLSCAPR